MRDSTGGDALAGAVLGVRTTTHGDRRCDLARTQVETVALGPIGKIKNFIIILPLPYAVYCTMNYACL